MLCPCSKAITPLMVFPPAGVCLFKNKSSFIDLFADEVALMLSAASPCLSALARRLRQALSFSDRATATHTQQERTFACT